jgi:H+/Cl- antiporter ClcA
MTRKDVVKEYIGMIKLFVGAIFGAIFGLIVYNIQTSGSNFSVVIVAIVVLGLSAIYLAGGYKKLMDELNGLP